MLEDCKRKVSRRDGIDGAWQTYGIVSARVTKCTPEHAGERGVVDRSKSRGTIPGGIYWGADESTIALPVVEGESMGRGEQRNDIRKHDKHLFSHLLSLCYLFADYLSL